MTNDDTPICARAGGSGAFDAGAPMGTTGAFRGARGARVLVRELADITSYGGRRARFEDTIGTIRGLVIGEAVALTADGQACSVTGPTKLVLVDDFGQEHELEFGADDCVTLLD